MDSGEAWAPLLIVAFFATILLGMIRWGVEPYPAIIMPGFPGRGVPLEGGVHLTTVDIVVRFSDGSTSEMALDDVFHPLPRSAYFALSAHFRPRSPRAAPPSGAFLRRVLPGWEMRQRRLQQPPYDATIREWLHDRVVMTFPGSEPRIVEFRWYRDHFRPPAAEPEHRELLAVVEIQV